MAKKLVIVESPAKSRTLAKILGRGYSIKASLGHVRDLPRGQMGVDVENNFTPRYVIPKAKTKLVNELKQVTKDATTIYLATDPDREGEAIAWHLAAVAGDKGKDYKRVVFREITEEAVKEAFASQQFHDWLLAYDLMEPVEDKTTPQVPLQDALERMRQFKLDYLSVVAGPDNDKLMGLIEQRSVNRALTEEIIRRQNIADNSHQAQ